MFLRTAFMSRVRRDAFNFIYLTPPATTTVYVPPFFDLTGYVNWGDGSPVETAGVNSSHTYSTAGQYTVTYTYFNPTDFINIGQPSVGFSYAGKILKLDTNSIATFASAFAMDTLVETSAIYAGSATNFDSMFKGASNLTTVGSFTTSTGTSFSSMFESCTSLTTVPNLDMSNGTSFTDTFKTCTALTSILAFGFRYSVSIADTAMTLSAIVAFLTNLGTAFDSSQDVSMSAPQFASLSANDKAIAYDKGWTVNGTTKPVDMLTVTDMLTLPNMLA